MSEALFLPLKARIKLPLIPKPTYICLFTGPLSTGLVLCVGPEKRIDQFSHP